MDKKYLILFAAAAWLAPVAGHSQENKNKIPSEVVSVEKDYNPDVKAGKKVNFTPDETPETGTKLPVSYKSEADAPVFDLAAQPVSALVMDTRSASAQYSNYLKAGIGYNLSTMAEGYYSLTAGKSTFSAGLNHDRAERDISFFKDNSAFSHTDASVSFKYAMARYDLGAYAKYAYHSFTNNGTRLADPALTNLPLKFRHNGITGGVFLRSNAGRRAFDHLNVEVAYMNGALGTNDTYVKATTGFYFPVKKVTFSLDVAAAYYDNKSVGLLGNPAKVLFGHKTTTTFGHFMVTPAVSYKNDRLDVYAGLRMELLTGNRISADGSDGSRFHIMPEIKAAYSIIDGLMSVYARLESGYQVQNMSSLLHENPWLSPTTGAFYSHDKFKAQAGLSGVFSSAVRYDLSFSYGQTNNAPAWVMTQQVLDDKPLSYYSAWKDDIGLFTLRASVDYTINPAHRVAAFGEYLNHSSDAFTSALYLPDFRLGASYRGSVAGDRIDLYGRIAYNGSATGLVRVSSVGFDNTLDEFRYENVGGFVEYQANATYNFAPRWGVFVEVNNTIDGRAFKYYGYDWCGVRALVGVKFNF